MKRINQIIKIVVIDKVIRHYLQIYYLITVDLNILVIVGIFLGLIQDLFKTHVKKS